MSGVVAVVLAGLALVGCGRVIAPAVPNTHLVFNHGAGLSFEVPADFAARLENRTLVFSGPRGTPSFYTTLTLQCGGPGDADDQALSDALAQAYADVERADVAKTLSFVDGWPTLSYNAAFIVYERPRRRAGVLLASPSAIIDFAYTAPAELFESGLSMYERALATLSLSDTDGGPCTGSGGSDEL